MTTDRCQVYFAPPPHHLHRVQCMNRATTERGGVRCCGTHARQADKWDAAGRMQTMIDYWWKP